MSPTEDALCRAAFEQGWMDARDYYGADDHTDGTEHGAECSITRDTHYECSCDEAGERRNARREAADRYPAGVDRLDEELTPPATPAERLAGASYALGQLARLAANDPSVLDSIADDLAEVFLLAVPAAEHVELVLEDGAVA